MPTTTVILIVLAVVLLAGVAALLMQRRMLRRRFGDEYDRLVEEYQSRPKAERELHGRRRRRASLTLRTLPDSARIRYTRAWLGIESQFIDDPRGAATEADALFTDMLAEIGFPTTDFDERLSALSVDHARVLEHYREAHDISVHADDASTEQLRQALMHFRVLFADLLGEDRFPEESTGAPPRDAGMPMPAGGEKPVLAQDNESPEDPLREARKTS